MKIFEKKRLSSGRRRVYIFGVKIFSYKKKSDILKEKEKERYNAIWAKRFMGLTEEETQFVINYRYKSWVSRKYGTSKGINWEAPTKYNEKIQWLMLYYRNPLMTICQDKVKVQQYIRKKIGADMLVPCIGVWESPEDIPFDELPNKFAVKVNWGCGQNLIVEDKTQIDWEEAKKKLADWMQPNRNWYYTSLEWAYKHIQPQIIVEKYIEQNDDYKIACFNGKARLVQVCTDRDGAKHKQAWYDVDWNRLPFTRNTPEVEHEVQKPKHLEQMLQCAEILAEPFPLVRVDFYYSNGKPYIGEMTFYPAAGLKPFTSPEWDDKIGEMIQLPEKMLWSANATTEDL